MSAVSHPNAAPTFRHGVHPPEFKDATAALPVERMPYVEEYTLPLSQHAGAPSVAVVKAGDRVQQGELLAKPGGFVSTALHSPVTGTVKAVDLRPHPNGKLMPAVVITTDMFASQRFEPRTPVDPLSCQPEERVKMVQDAGLVGLGGAAFPSHVKLKLPDGKKARFVILNGCECEPYLTCDHRMMVERPQAVVEGLRILLAHLGAERGYIGIETNKQDAIDALKAVVADATDVIVVPLMVKYPQGAEKMLINAVFAREVPSGKLPLDLEMVVNNVGTAIALSDLFGTGMPLIERVVTVTGPGIRRAANVMVPLGTPLRALIEHCGGLLPETRQVILGGPMMGQAQKDLDVPVLKGVSGVVALTRPPYEAEGESECIRCGRCLEACPMFLNPSRLAALTRAEVLPELNSHHVMDCFECGSCAFVCPSRIPLVQLIRLGKVMVRQKKAKG